MEWPERIKVYNSRLGVREDARFVRSISEDLAIYRGIMTNTLYTISSYEVGLAEVYI